MIEPIWRLKSIDEDCVNKVAETFSIPKTIARVMSLRGIQNREESKKFFYPHLEGLHDPFNMEDMDKAVTRILQTISEKKSILIFGDYDVDGTTSAAFLTLFFQSLEVDVHYYIPSREKEGYGVSRQGIEYAKLIGADILITCDCGINAFEQVDFANSLGIEVIISDHHKPEATLPAAAAVINPNRQDCNYPFKGLCGAGVAFKLALALCVKGGYDQALAWKHSDLITLGIAADLVPIKDENRIIVHYGIRQMQKQTNPGVTALLKTGGLWKKELTVGRLVFWMAPKINAAGRLEHASISLNLLTAQSPDEAQSIAEQLNSINKDRQNIGSKIFDEAVAKIELEKLDDKKVLVLKGDNWHPGVIGIVASKLADKYYRPAILIGSKGEVGRGSARSVDEINIYQILLECQDLFTSFGGHACAAGFEINLDDYDSFCKTIEKKADQFLTPDKLKPHIIIDGNLQTENLTLYLAKEIDLLAPFGEGNEIPIFISKEMKLEELKKVGSNGLHLKARFNGIDTIGFGLGHLVESLSLSKRYDLLYNLECNEWNGFERVQLKLIDIKPS